MVKVPAGVSNSLSLLLAGKEESRKAKQTICSCLDGLQKAARLSCVLGIFLLLICIFLVAPSQERSDLSGDGGVCALVWLVAWL